MATHSWTIIDTESNTFDAEFAAHGALRAGMPDGWSVRHYVLRGGKRDGVSYIEVNNGRMTLMVLPTRGMSIWRAWMEGKALGWRSPVSGPVHPRFVPIFDPSGLGWLEGFDELVVRCGLESNGAPDFDENGRLLYPLHGRIGNLPAHKVDVTVDDEAGTITVRGEVDESRFHFQKLRLSAAVTTRFNSTSFTLDDEVQNFGGTPATMQMLYHINIGEPLLDPGSRLVAPVASVAPRNAHAADGIGAWQTFAAPMAGYEEQVYFAELTGDDSGNTQVLLKNSAASAGVGVRCNKQTLPYFLLWKNTAALNDGYVTGLEPGTNFPNPRSFETQQRRIVNLPAGGKWQTSVHVDWHTSPQEVAAAEAQIQALQGNTRPDVHKQPLPEWSI
jgi:hypothetical protein